MEQIITLDGLRFSRMIRAGAASLQARVTAINDLNVFPIPDGDTGDNMLYTILGGVNAVGEGTYSLSDTARRAADGMLLGARGNSGVILSQFFDGIAAGLDGYESADAAVFAEALQSGVRHAYGSVVEPTEGTILTVVRCAARAAANGAYKKLDVMLDAFIEEAKRTLETTPDLLPVLKKAGVVDSGGAGLICIAEGMKKALTADGEIELNPIGNAGVQSIDLDKFTSDSVLEYGYCTELLVRLQNAKTDIDSFDIDTVTNFLQTVGNSVVAFRTGSVVKIHIHTMTPDKVLAFCQTFGEFLTVKIENMSLQHNNTELPDEDEFAYHGNQSEQKKAYGIVAVCAGDGVKEFFTERGADIIVDGGQSMNPSTEDFLAAFDKVNAETILVLPNNGNIILAAGQAAALYKKADVRVIGSKTIGDGYAALSMLDTGSNDTDAIVEELTEAMDDVVTVMISRSIRDTSETKAGEYIGFVGKDILCSHADRLDTAVEALDKAGIGMRDICILIYGKDADGDEAETLMQRIDRQFPGKELFLVDGKQDIYDYILILE